jgi:hypothetical protein
MIRTFLRLVIGLVVAALVAPATLAGQRQGKVINVVPPKPKPKTPPKFEVPTRYDGNVTQLKKWDGAPGFTGPAVSITKTTAKLTWEAIPDDDDLPPLPVRGKPATTTRSYQPVDGEITIEVSVRTENPMTRCDVQDTRTFSVKALSQETLQGMRLTVGSDGTYQLDLAVAATELQWYAKAKCVTMGAKESEVKMSLGTFAFALGHQQGAIEYGVHGETKTPMKQGGFTITGSWNFAAVKDR